MAGSAVHVAKSCINRREHWLGVAPKLGEKYRVTLTAGMKDVLGQKLDKDVTFEGKPVEVRL